MVEFSVDNMLECNKNYVAHQKLQIEVALKEPMMVGQVWNVIEASWFKRFKCFVGIDSSGRVGKAAYPGPIDNSLILDSELGDMKSGLIEGLDFVVVPNSAWIMLCQWYGVKDNQSIERPVINVGKLLQIEPKLEVYKIELKIYDSPESSNPITYQFSRVDSISKIETICRKMFSIPSDTVVHLRGIFGPNKSYILDSNKTLQEEFLTSDIKIVCEIVDENRKGITSSQELVSKGVNRVPVVLPRQGVVFKSVSDCQDSLEGRGRPCTPGLSGLANLGNTCFMNSIIQCLSNCRPITKYFLEGNHKSEINTSNPLGKAGQIANSFANVISTIWSGKHSITLPRQFKFQLTYFAPQFAGYRQHDAQELLTFLLDGLHEDLNRVKDKPYCQVEETEQEEDEEIARKSWEYFLSRNDSIIIDNFHGMLKSRVVCPDCAKVSIKFDTFSSLSLPLPLPPGKTTTMTLHFLPYDQGLKEQDISITVHKTACFRDLALEVSNITKVGPDCLVFAEVFESHFHKFFSSDDPIVNRTQENMICMYDLPPEVVGDSACNFAIVPVAFYEVDSGSSLGTFFGTPFLLVLPRGPITRNSLNNKICERITRCWSGPFKDSLNSNCLDTAQGEKTHSSLFAMDNLFTPVLIDAFYIENIKNIPFDAQGVFNVPGNFGREFLALKILKEFRLQHFKDSSALRETSFEKQSNESKKPTLETCLALFTTTERLRENNAWHCPRCKKKKQATKKLDLWKLPNILVLHLKRFLFNETRREKIDLEVEFPLSGLNIDHYVINKEKESFIYDLVGVCNHFGTLSCGHYTAICKNHNDGNWYCFDDSSVYQVLPEFVQSRHAYVLFYQRRPPPNL